MATVLIVEDDPANREVFTRILTRAGYEVVAAENGLAGLAELSAHSVDAIVCDIAMAELSGIGFYEQVEEQFPDLASRVVFVTAYADEPRVQQFLRATGQPVMQKPVELHALVENVRETIARH